MEEINEQAIKEYKCEHYNDYKRIRKKIQMALILTLHDPYKLNEYLITWDTKRDIIKTEVRGFYDPMPFAENEYAVARVDCETIPKHVIYSLSKRDFFVQALKDIDLYDDLINVAHVDFYQFELFERRFCGKRWYRLIEKDYMTYCEDYFLEHGLEMYTDQLTNKALIRLAKKGVIELPVVEHKEVTDDEDDLPF